MFEIFILFVHKRLHVIIKTGDHSKTVLVGVDDRVQDVSQSQPSYLLISKHKQHFLLLKRISVNDIK